eukprot:scaffold42330_cov28-Tisochrysis_lutea.AAC.2
MSGRILLAGCMRHGSPGKRSVAVRLARALTHAWRPCSGPWTRDRRQTPKQQTCSQGESSRMSSRQCKRGETTTSGAENP